MSRDTLCFSMYSLISMRIINFSSSKRNSASARASSVFSDACRSEENERADRQLGVGKTCAAAAHGIRHALQRVVLADTPLASAVPPCARASALRLPAIGPSECPSTCSPASRCLSSSTSSFSMGRALVQRRESFLRLLLFALRRRNLAVADFRHLGQFAGSFVSLLFRFELFNLLLELADFSDGFLSACHRVFRALESSFSAASSFSICLRRSFECASLSFSSGHGAQFPAA